MKLADKVITSGSNATFRSAIGSAVATFCGKCRANRQKRPELRCFLKPF